MEISEITNIIMSCAPAITAVIGIIVALGVGIGNIKRANKDTVESAKQAHRDTIEEVRKQNAEIIENVAQIAKNNEKLKQENEELKGILRKVMAKLNHVHIDDK